MSTSFWSYSLWSRFFPPTQKRAGQIKSSSVFWWFYNSRSELPWCSSVVPQRRHGIFFKAVECQRKRSIQKRNVAIETEIQSCSSKTRQSGDTRAQKVSKKKPIWTKFVSDSLKNGNSTNFFGSTNKLCNRKTIPITTFQRKLLSKMQVVNDSAERAILLAKPITIN